MAKPKAPKFQNMYSDVYEFMMDLRLKIGANVMLALMLNEGNLVISIYFTKIPSLAKLSPYTTIIEPTDLQEPGDNTTKVLVDDIKKYMDENKIEIPSA